MAIEIPLYTPSPNQMRHSLLQKYIDWLFIKKGIYFHNYDDLWQWSVSDIEAFWDSIFRFFAVETPTDYRQVLYRPADADMIGCEWFDGAKVSYAGHIFRHQTAQRPALLFASERQPLTSISWDTLAAQVAAVSAWLRQQNVQPGDRVVAVLPNIPQAVVGFLAANAIGAVWSSCSPDFGIESMADRFGQIEPKILLAADGYTYNGKEIDKTNDLRALQRQLPTLRQVVWIPYLNPNSRLPGSVWWQEVLQTPIPDGLTFEPMPFNSPIWVLYSSGTTGKPKAITHSVGGCLLEHLKALALHQDVQPGDRYFWYSTTGWMMWNYAVGSLLVGATLVLYDGAAGFPDLNRLWTLAEQAGIQHVGGGAAYFLACMRANLKPQQTVMLPNLRSIGATGSPLPAEGFRWVYDNVRPDVWLISLSGGTDVCTAFVGGNPLLPVYAGEIQCRMLGCYVEAFDEAGTPVRDALGEMVILKPMPSMPIYFWNDPDNRRYRDSYFADYAGIWRHGDYIRITRRGSVVIYGRSDATLNRDGIRIGTAEIYSAVEQVPEVADSLIVGVELPDGRYYMPLFVVLNDGCDLTNDLQQRIRHLLRQQGSPRHVPDAIFTVREIPYTISGKKLETPIKKILLGTEPTEAASLDSLRNPAALYPFVGFRNYIPIHSPDV